MSKGTPEYHPVEEDFEHELDESERELDEEEDSESESERSFREAIDTAASQAQDAARSSITGSLVSETTAKALAPHRNPNEAISRPDPNARFDGVMDRVQKALSKLTDADVSRAHARFVEEVLGIDLSGVSADKRGAEADRILTALTLKVQGKPVPSSGNPTADAQLQAITDQFLGLKDATFWKAMADTWQGRPLTIEEAQDHLLFLRAAEDLTAPPDPAKGPRTFVWRTKAAKLSAIDKIIAAGGAAPDPNANPPGRIDVAAMYRQAATIKEYSNLLPREMAIELVRVALAQLVQGASAAKRPNTPLPVHQPNEGTLRTRLKPEPQPTPAMSPTERLAVKARNSARTSALALFAEKPEPIVDPTAKGMVEMAYLGRQNLRTVFEAGIGDLSLALLRPIPVKGTPRNPEGTTRPPAQGLSTILTSAVEGSGLAEALSKWSQVYTSTSPQPDEIASALTEVKAGMSKFAQGVGSDMSGDRQVLLGAHWLSNALRVEIVREAAELLPDPMQPPVDLDRGTRFGGARAAVDLASVRGRARRAAIHAREAPGGLGKFTARTLSEVATQGWAKDLIAAAGAWSTADDADTQSMLTGTDALATALGTARTALATAAPENRYRGEMIIDALASAAGDRISALAAVGAGVSSADATGRLAQLQAFLVAPVEPAKLSSYWSKGKDTISGSLPDGLTLDLTSRIGAWVASVRDSRTDPEVITARTMSVTQAVNDYRTRIEAGDNTPADKAILLTLLDTILGTVGTRLAGMDS